MGKGAPPFDSGRMVGWFGDGVSEWVVWWDRCLVQLTIWGLIHVFLLHWYAWAEEGIVYAKYRDRWVDESQKSRK